MIDSNSTPEADPSPQGEGTSQTRPNPVFWPSLAAGVIAFVLDRGQKFVQIEMAGWGALCPPPETTALCPHEQVAPFFSYVLVWNPGISYGLLQNLPLAALVGLMLAASAVLAYWWVRADTALTRFGLAICLGGAVSHLVDRVLYGAVPDFFFFYWQSFSFYVFNLSDTAITIGVILLLIDMVLPQRKAAG